MHLVYDTKLPITIGGVTFTKMSFKPGTDYEKEVGNIAGTLHLTRNSLKFNPFIYLDGTFGVMPIISNMGPCIPNGDGTFDVMYYFSVKGNAYGPGIDRLKKCQKIGINGVGGDMFFVDNPLKE